MPTSWTIKSVLDWTAQDFQTCGIPSARLDAELLIAHALQLQRIQLYLKFDQPLLPNELANIKAYVVRRRTHEPVGYILGTKGFYGRDFHVSPAVLIPRPDTETLIVRALELLPTLPQGPILDVCTGSGVLGITLALEHPDRHAVLADLSEEALTIARANVTHFGLTARTQCAQGDLFQAIKSTPDLPQAYPLIVANPPYITSSDIHTLAPNVRDFEPHLALDGGVTGLDIYAQLIPQARQHLSDKSCLLLEVGENQAEAVAALCTQHGYTHVTCHQDFHQIARVVEAHVRQSGVAS